MRLWRRRNAVGRASALLCAWIACAAGAAAQTTGQPAPTTDPARAGVPLSEIPAIEISASAPAAELADNAELLGLYESARAAFEDAKFEEAARKLREALDKTDTDYFELLYLEARLEALQGRLDAASAAVRKAAALRPQAVDAHWLLGLLLRQQDQIEPAIAELRAATLAGENEVNNQNVTLAWLQLGECLMLAGYDFAAAQAYAQFDEALWVRQPEQRNARPIQEILKNHPHGLLETRLDLLRKLKRADEAVAVTQEALQRWPDDLSVARLHARTLLEVGRAREAYDFCRGRTAGPEGGGLLTTYIEAAAAADQLDALVAEREQALTNGQGLDLGREATLALRRAGHEAQATKLGRAVLAQPGADQDLSWEVAEAQRATGDLRGGLITLIESVRRRPQALELPRQRLTSWCAGLGKGEGLLPLVNELRQQPHRDFATDFVLGVSALGAGQTALAEELLAAVQAAQPNFTPAYVVRGQMALARYHWDAARQAAEQLIKRKPDLAAGHFLLAEALDGLDDNEKSAEAYKRAIQLKPDSAEYALALARHCRRLGEMSAAQRYFAAAVTTEPTNGEAYEGLLDAYLRDGKQDLAREIARRMEAAGVSEDSLRRATTTIRFLNAPFSSEHLAELQRQVEQHPGDVDTGRLLAAGLFQAERFDEAERAVQRTLAASPDDFHTLMLSATLHQRQADFEQAVRELEGLSRRYPNRATVLNRLAEAYLCDFRTEEAWSALRAVAERDASRKEEYLKRLAELYHEFREFDKAIATYDELLKESPDDESLNFLKLTVMLSAGRKDDAAKLARERLDQAPQSAARLQQYLYVGQQAGQGRAVEEVLRQRLENRANDPELTANLVSTLLQDQRAADALQVARDFQPASQEESVLQRMWMAESQAKAGEIDKAVAEYEALLGERSVSEFRKPRIQFDLVRTLIDGKRYDAALERCDKLLSEDRARDPAARDELLLLKTAALQAAGREQEYAQVMALRYEANPDDAGLNNDLGYTWIDMGKNVQRATAMIRKAVAERPLSAAYLDSLGWACYKAGDFPQAEKWLSRAARLREGSDPVIYDHLGDALLRQGNISEAGKHWGKALELIEMPATAGMAADRTELTAALRSKLAAVAQSQEPKTAPTAAEQEKQAP